jgi:SAM-dependent methyltransferase
MDSAEPAAQDYVTDVPYIRSFARDLCPSRLRLVAALNGFPPPPARNFDYCELGSAHGDTTAALAAAYPEARFVGVDINPEHTLAARAIAHDARLHNVQFLEEDFEALATKPLPNFDFMTAHGVMSWVAPEKRRALIKLAAAKLKKGGLFYVGYNALPGWAPIEPLRRLIVARAASVGGDSLERAKAGVDFAKLLREAGAAYFTNNGPAREMLTTMERGGYAYVAHEYMNAHWTPMYFQQMAEEMAAGDLYFAGQLPLHLNYRDLAVPPSLAPLFKDVTDRITFETLKDYALDQYFRCDVFVKGRIARSDETTNAYFETTPFGALFKEAAADREVRLPHYTLSFRGALFDALLPALGERATTLGDLAGRPELEGFGTKAIRDAVVRLTLSGRAAPMLDKTATPPKPSPEDDGALYQVPLAYNRMIVGAPMAKERPLVLASPVAGTALPISRLEAVAMHLLTSVPPAARPAWIRKTVREHPLRLTVQEKAVSDVDALVPIVLAETERLRTRRAGTFTALGILAQEERNSRRGPS